MKRAMIDVPTPITHSYGMTKTDFFESIRKLGGWQKGNKCKYLAFYHSIESKNRECKYFTFPVRTGWWTSVCSKNDYLDYIKKWYRTNLRNQREGGKVSTK